MGVGMVRNNLIVRAFVGAGVAMGLLGGCATQSTQQQVTQQTVVVVATPGAGASAPAAPALPVGGIMACTEESKLNSVMSKQPVEMVLRNQSGSVRKLYWLDFDGKRKLYATIENDRTHAVSTFITHPWLIADKADHCVSIIIPGRTTQAVSLNK
jgi:VHL beta domain